MNKSGKRNYLIMRKELLRLAREKDVPISGTFELTGRCNFSCKMCYVHVMNETEAKKHELSTNQWKKVFDDAYEAGLMFALLTGGECLLRSDFKELYLYLWNRGVNITVNTNGYLLNNSYISFFERYPPKRIQISLYGCDELMYQSITGVAAFSRVSMNISKLKKSGIDVHLAITPSKYLLDSCTDTIRYAIENDYDFAVSELLLKPREKNENNDYFLTAEEYADILANAATLRGQKLTPASEELLPKPGGEYGGPETVVCNGGRSRFYITWKGEMCPCVVLPSIHADVLDIGYKAAWQYINSEVKKILQAEECVNCAYKKVCSICPGVRHDDIWDRHCNSETCKFVVEKCKRGLCAI